MHGLYLKKQNTKQYKCHFVGEDDEWEQLFGGPNWTVQSKDKMVLLSLGSVLRGPGTLPELRITWQVVADYRKGSWEQHSDA